MFDPGTLRRIPDGTDINTLDRTRLRNLQRALCWMTYPVSVIDGLIGPNTRSAFAEFKADIGQDDPEIFTATCGEHAIKFISRSKDLLHSDTSSKETTRQAISDLCAHMGLGLDTQVAYVLATAQWETNHTFEPVREAYWLSEDWRRQHLRYYPYYGRGYVQLTWKRNYSHYGNIVRERLSTEPDLALDPEIALLVLVHGFKLGAFTGRKLEDYVNAGARDFINARRCINGLDRAEEIAEIAEGYL